jgi:uncharacterized protein YbaR (Trm112 family)
MKECLARKDGRQYIGYDVMSKHTRKIKCPSCNRWLRIHWNDEYFWENFICSLCNARFRIWFDISGRIPKVINKEVLEVKDNRKT